MGDVSAQQMPVYSQYFANGFMVNPALAGSDGTTKFQLSVRDYMIGIAESPKTFTASGNGRLLRRQMGFKNGKSISQSGRVGMGGLVYSDYFGLVNRIGMQYTYAYHIDLSHSQLSLGLSAALSQTRINVNEKDFNDPEPLLKEGFGNLVYVPDAALGIFYKKDEHYIGLTASNLFQRSIRFGEFDHYHIMYRHFFLLGGTSFDIGQYSYIAPAFLLKATSNKMYQGEFSMRFSHRDDAWIALTYRTPQIASMMFGMHAKNLIICYTFEYNFNILQTYSFGAHELCVIYRLGSMQRRYQRLIGY